MNRTLFVSSVLALGLAAASASAQERTFQIRDSGSSRIQFVSDAPLEMITGVTSGVTGEIRVNPAQLSSARGRAEVRIATLRTGVDLRDEHLRGDNWLNAQRFPTAAFEVTGVEGATSLQPGQSTPVRIRGRFTLRGVTKNIVAEGRARLIPTDAAARQAPGITGDVVRVQASFSINLPEYGVSVPAVIRLKVSDEIQVNVDLIGVEAAPATAARP